MLVFQEIMKLTINKQHLLKILRWSLAKSNKTLAAGCIPCQRCDERRLCTDRSQSKVTEWDKPFHLDPPDLNLEYLCNPENTERIHQNLVNRKGVGDIHRVVSLWQDYQKETEAVQKESLKKQLIASAQEIPNNSHPDSPVGDEDKAKLLDLVGTKRDFDFKPKSVVQLGEKLGLLRTENVSMTTGERTYYFINDLAKLEQALVQFTLDKVRQKGFQFVTVPDMIHPEVIESCGFKTTGERTQVYKLDPIHHGDVCLAGTSEMPLAGYFMNEEMDLDELPIKLTAVSRCYRAETSDLQEEKGIYRVHQFTKVEMFAVTGNETGNESDDLMEDLLDLQMDIFSQLGLHFRVLDMPTQELGAPAHRKYDIETWMPAKQFWGEISSTSNCTDYQSRRLHIKYTGSDGYLKHSHTVNGTACAVPRMIMAIMENHQNQDGTVSVPEVLQPYMKTPLISKPEKQLHYEWLKSKKIKSRT